MFVDESYRLPESLFRAQTPVWCTMFVQDAKIDFQRLLQREPGAVRTCEFGLAAASQWGKEFCEGGICKPFEKVARILNARGLALWLMAEQRVVQQETERAQDDAFLEKFQKCLSLDPRNILSLEYAGTKLQTFPTPYPQQEQFHPSQLASYYAVGLTPYFDLPIAHFADITGRYATEPRIVMMDGGPVGPANRVLGYKHMTRLIMNGTAASGQNPHYVIVESTYTPQLASFLTGRFEECSRLVLKHVAASRGEGVVILDATTVERLDAQLQEHLLPGSSFKAVSEISVCLVEEFVSTAERRDNGPLQETIVRLAHFALQDQWGVEHYTLAGVKAYEDPASHSNSKSRGMVKLGKYNTGKIEALSDSVLGLISEQIFVQMIAVARRAMSYDPEAALEYYLRSDNLVMNLIGVELFEPTLVCSMRERTKGGVRVSDHHCQLLLELIERNRHPTLLRRLFENVLMTDAMRKMEPSTFDLQLSPKLIALLQRLAQLAPESGLKEHFTQGLLKIYMHLFIQGPLLDEPLVLFMKQVILLLTTSLAPGWPLDTKIASSFLDAYAQYNLPKLDLKEECLGLKDLRALAPSLECVGVAQSDYAKVLDTAVQRIDKRFDHRLLWPAFRHMANIIKAGQWSQEDFNHFVQWMQQARDQYCIPYAIGLLPELICLKMTGQEAVEIVKEYFRDPFAQNAYFNFHSLLRTLTQLQGFDNEVHRFIAQIVKFRCNGPCFQALIHYLFTGMQRFKEINQLLVFTNQQIAAHLAQESSPSGAHFANLVKSLNSKIQSKL